MINLFQILAFANGELNLLTFSQGLAPFHGDCTEMNEYITLTFPGNEAIALFVIKPFDCACY